MPTITLPNSEHKVWPYCIIQIMTDPDCRHPGRLANVMKRQAPLLTGLDTSHPFFASYFSQLFREAAVGERVSDYLRETERVSRSGDISRGPMSGHILLHILSRAATGDQRVSINRTCELIAQACQNRVHGAQHRELKAIWERYSPVSHLWAAMTPLGPKWAEVSSSRQKLLTWLSHAEGLRRYGEVCKLWRSPTRPTLLDPKRTWCLLPTEPLPDVTIHIPAPDLIIAELGSIGRSK